MVNTKTVKQRTGNGKWHSVFVLISCCLMMLLHIGILYSIGTLFTDFMTAFNSTRAETAVIQSASIGVLLGLGIFIGALINKVGLRTVGMLGSLVASVGLMACFFASSLTYMVISVCVVSGIFIGALINKVGLRPVGMLGSLAASVGLMACFFASSLTYMIISVCVVSRFGFSCVYISSAAAISQHFSSRKQFLYLSMHASSSGIGGMLYPYLMRYLSDRYGYRGALLLIGGICLNTVAGCILWKKRRNTIKRQEYADFTNQINEFQRRLQVKTESSGEIIVIEKLKQTPSAETSDFECVSQYPVLQGETETKTVVVQAMEENSTVLNKSKEEDQTLCENIRQILRNKSFMIFVIGMICLNPTMMMMVIFVADIYRDNGLSKDDVSLGLFLTNVMSIVGRLLPGILLQSKRIPPLLLPLINALVFAVVIVVFIFVKSPWLIIGLTGALGIPLGTFSSMMTVVTLKLVGSKALPVALGLLFTLNSVGQMVSGPVNGYIRDVMGSYTAIFYIAAGVNLFGAVVFYIAHITRRKEKRDIKSSPSVFFLTNF